MKTQNARTDVLLAFVHAHCRHASDKCLHTTYMYVCMYAYMYTRSNTHTHTYMYVRMYTKEYIWRWWGWGLEVIECGQEKHVSFVLFETYVCIGSRKWLHIKWLHRRAARITLLLKRMATRKKFTTKMITYKKATDSIATAISHRLEYIARTPISNTNRSSAQVNGYTRKLRNGYRNSCGNMTAMEITTGQRKSEKSRWR